ncbi:hypothetical protein [Nonomuraea typhae]|uniref:hypothetical protein n=1 Tax=Nonomuraea typhae TaxID=2603600 RepID=UPI0012F88967|nr:hypothetical protein [Nonomuraea typhae]
MTPEIWVSIVAGVSAVVGAGFSFRASTRANQLAERKVEQEAYDKNIAYYEKLVARLEKDLDQLRATVDRANDQLAHEQDVSKALRDQIRTMQRQLDILERTLNELRGSTDRPQAMEGQ